jgi:hypothetical protein
VLIIPNNLSGDVFEINHLYGQDKKRMLIYANSPELDLTPEAELTSPPSIGCIAAADRQHGWGAPQLRRRAR